MKKIKNYLDFDINESFEEEDIINIPLSVIKDWILVIEAQEESLNQTIFVKDAIQDFLYDYYDYESSTDASKDFDKKHSEEQSEEPENEIDDIDDLDEIDEIDELSSDDEDPTFIKKFEKE